MDDPQTRIKTISIENARKALDKENPLDKPRKKVILKENLYNNLKCLMENKKIKLYDDERIRQSLKSIQYEIEDNKLKIYGNFSHITEALIRAAWSAKEKHLNPYIS